MDFLNIIHGRWGALSVTGPVLNVASGSGSASMAALAGVMRSPSFCLRACISRLYFSIPLSDVSCRIRYWRPADMSFVLSMKFSISLLRSVLPQGEGFASRRPMSLTLCACAVFCVLCARGLF